MNSISAVIITFNEEKNIERCLQSLLNVVDEIVVVDSFSKDRTKEICLRLGARFIENKFDGHIQQKNFAWQQASCDYVISLDADEALDETLKKEVIKIKNSPTLEDGYSMNRLTNYCGKWIKHSGWYPDVKLRLFKKGAGEWGGENPHDKFELLDKAKTTIHLKGDLLHYSYYTIDDHYRQIELFSNIASNALFEKGRKISLPMIYIKVVVQYIKTAFLKLGFLDGKAGWTIARMSAFATYQKYSKLKKRWKDDTK